MLSRSMWTWLLCFSLTGNSKGEGTASIGGGNAGSSYEYVWDVMTLSLISSRFPGCRSNEGDDDHMLLIRKYMLLLLFGIQEEKIKQ